jgi:hypothetical protein
LPLGLIAQGLFFEAKLTTQTLIGIDPGNDTGVAIYDPATRQISVQTLKGNAYIVFLQVVAASDAIVYFEDSREISSVYSAAGKKRAVSNKISRNVGMIDEKCRTIEELCAARWISYVSVSPKSKGAKLNAAQFQARTGLKMVTNQHERDAVMLIINQIKN